MSHHSRPTAPLPHHSSSLHRLASWVMVGLMTATLVGAGATAAEAATVCDPANDLCVVTPDTVQTPLGLVSVTVSSSSVVTVHLAPASANTVVVGVPFTVPAGLFLSCPGGCARTSIDTSGGLVTIDTIQIPPGAPGRLTLPNLAIISIHPPGPCRARTIGTTVVFTPIRLPLARSIA
jgi:hypothetical protein